MFLFRLTVVLQLFLVALISYLLGCVNGALLTSKVFYRDDVRRHGSGNAGLTNFYRTYGAKYAWCVIAVDMLKAAVAVEVGVLVIGAIPGKYFAALFCIIGHMFPVFYKFKGGKGILCGGMALILIDWRIALVGWGLFLLLWAITKYVSLGSVCAAVSFPIMTYVVFGNMRIVGEVATEALLMAVLVIWAHRGNIKRLLHGKESRFTWHK